jgi:hypothetical protein
MRLLLLTVLWVPKPSGWTHSSDLKDHRGYRASRAIKVLRVCRESKASKVTLEIRVHKESKESRGYKGFPETMELPASTVLTELMVQTENPLL